MNNNMTIREMMTAARVLKKQGERFTLLGVGPMSKTLLTAALSLAKERDFPLMLIASRNQVDSDEFGHGYVCGWDQDRFVKDVEAAAAAVGFDGLVYLCRDHGGPWQRDEERAAGLPVEEAMEIIKSREKPLACYLFTEDRRVQDRFLRQVPFGGGCINDTVIHLATSHMGFGGVGASGMGSYHGKKSLETFSHSKSIVRKSTWMDLPIRYAPYTRAKEALLRLFLR